MMKTSLAYAVEEIDQACFSHQGGSEMDQGIAYLDEESPMTLVLQTTDDQMIFGLYYEGGQ